MGNKAKDIPGNKAAQLTFRMPSEIAADFKEIAYQLRRPMAAIVCELVDGYVKKKKKDGVI